MATHKFITCDACGKRFEYRNEKWAAILTAKKLKKFREIKLFYGNTSGYDYAEYNYELCGGCTKKLDELLRGSQKTEIIRCKDCKHKPYPSDNYDYDNGDCGVEIIFPDYRCPCRCDDEYYNRIPDDDWFCGNAERRTDADDKC